MKRFDGVLSSGICFVGLVMNARLFIAIGASAGGVGSLKQLLREFPKDTTAAYFITLHVAAHGTSILPGILSKTSGLPAEHVEARTKIIAGRIYIAPPNLHLLVERETVRPFYGPKENLQRPAINPMFRSLAEAHGKKVVGVVLTGMLDDGAAGLVVIKQQGGLTLVQLPEDSAFPEMPRHAIEAASPHVCRPLEQIRDLLVKFSTRGGAKLLPHFKQMHCRAGQTARHSAQHSMKPKNSSHLARVRRTLGAPTGLVCPECSGPLWEIGPANAKQYKCLVGHAYSPQSLDVAQSDEVERALWVALRALEQRADLQRRLAQQAERQGSTLTWKTFLRRAEESEKDAEILRRVIDGSIQ